MSQINATCVVLNEIPSGLKQPQKQGEWLPRDASYEYTAMVTSVCESYGAGPSEE